jgi:hypothetical protein
MANINMWVCECVGRSDVDKLNEQQCGSSDRPTGRDQTSHKLLLFIIDTVLNLSAPCNGIDELS